MNTSNYCRHCGGVLMWREGGIINKFTEARKSTVFWFLTTLRPGVGIQVMSSWRSSSYHFCSWLSFSSINKILQPSTTFVERNSRNFRENNERLSSNIFANFDVFRSHFHENFRLSLNIDNGFRYLSNILFDFLSRRMIVWGPHSWLTKLSRGWRG